MYSNIVYLMAEKYVPLAKTLDWKEILPNETKVNQKKLAETMIVASLVYLQEKKFINIYYKENQFLFLKSKNLYVRKISDDDGSLSGLEFHVLKNIKGDERLFDSLSTLLQGQVQNPWKNIIEIAKSELKERGIISISASTKSLFGSTGKLTLLHEYPDTELLMHDWNQAKENLTSDKPLFDKMGSEISKSLSAMLEQSANAN